jgi:hypothetical protein
MRKAYVEEEKQRAADAEAFTKKVADDRIRILRKKKEERKR